LARRLLSIVSDTDRILLFSAVLYLFIGYASGLVISRWVAPNGFKGGSVGKDGKDGGSHSIGDND
jgi:hypothetical protein